jgi:hypothetical protein
MGIKNSFQCLRIVAVHGFRVREKDEIEDPEA